MKTLFAAFPLALLMAVAPALAQAQATPAAKKTVKPAAKPAAAKRAATRPTVARKTRAARVKAIEEATPIDDDPAVQLTPADLEVAKLVHTGDIPCELGATVHVTKHKREGFFIVRAGIQRFRMHPVESRTGAIRLEDPVGGAMWLQLGNKSMLMSQKMGKRLADECMNPTQSAMNENLKKNPINILEPAPAINVVAPAAEEAARAAPPATPAAAEAQVPPQAPAVPEAPPATEAPAATTTPAVPAAPAAN